MYFSSNPFVNLWEILTVCAGRPGLLFRYHVPMYCSYYNDLYLFVEQNVTSFAQEFYRWEESSTIILNNTLKATEVYRDGNTLSDGQTQLLSLHSTTKATGPMRLLIRVYFVTNLTNIT